jgi:hypothetical protein
LRGPEEAEKYLDFNELAGCAGSLARTGLNSSVPNIRENSQFFGLGGRDFYAKGPKTAVYPQNSLKAEQASI